MSISLLLAVGGEGKPKVVSEGSTVVLRDFSQGQSGPKAGRLQVILSLRGRAKLGVPILKPAKNICRLVPIISVH